MVKKIVVLGPESTGKSTLCEMLAQHYNTLWCPEFAREYLLTNGTDYGFYDLLNIAKGQLALESEYMQMIGSPEAGEAKRREEGRIKQLETRDFEYRPNAFGLFDFRTPKPLFIDTDQYVMKVWCEYVFNDCHNWILRRIAERKYDLYLLCKPDLPWVKDDLREYPDEKPRQELFHIYRDLLIHQSAPWIEISGTYEERFDKALEAVNTILF